MGERYNVHVFMHHRNWRTQLSRVLEYLGRKHVAVDSLRDSRFVVRFDTEEEVEDFTRFLKELESGSPARVLLKTYLGHKHIASKSGLV